MEILATWCIYYGDGTTFSSSQGNPSDAPGRNVILIAQVRDATGCDYHSGWDWYFYHEDFGWWGCDRSGMEDQMLEEWKSIKRIVMGRSISNEKYKDIISRAKKEMPKQSATRKGTKAGKQRYGEGTNG